MILLKTTAILIKTEKKINESAINEKRIKININLLKL